MKAIDLYKTGLIISGIDDGIEIYLNENCAADQLFYINRVFCDLKVPQISSISQEITLKDNICDAAQFGIAYYLALRAGESERIAFLSDIYNAKRASALCQIKKIKMSSLFLN